MSECPQVVKNLDDLPVLATMTWQANIFPDGGWKYVRYVVENETISLDQGDHVNLDLHFFSSANKLC